MRTIDTRGLSCPQPLDVLVDNEASLENVTRAAEKKGWNVTPKDEGEGVFRLELRK